MVLEYLPIYCVRPWVSFDFFSLRFGLILLFHLKAPFMAEPMLIAKTPHTTCELLPDWPTATG
jgi:hypothetical protein